MDFVVTGLQAWDTTIGSNCKDMAAELAAMQHRVLYVCYPLDRSTLINDKDTTLVQDRLAKKGKNVIEQVAPNLWVLYPNTFIESINKIPFAFLFDFLNRRNNRLFFDCIVKALDTLGFKEVIHFNDNDIFRSFYAKEFLKPVKSIYYIRDYLLGVPYWQKHGKRLEPLLIQKSDLVATNSTHLCSYASKYTSNAVFIGQGCELTLFDGSKSFDIPSEFHAISKPIIGYVGALLSLRLNIDWLVAFAKARPNYTLVLVGPEDDDFKNSELHSLSNVVFMGPKKPETLPAYIQNFDVCLNPQVVNDVTIGNYPRKVDEYLAMGKPVVATYTPAMEMFQSHVSLVKSSDEMIQAIDLCLENFNEQQSVTLREFAQTHSWHNSVKTMLKYL